jgi:hypothetical protein
MELRFDDEDDHFKKATEKIFKYFDRFYDEYGGDMGGSLEEFREMQLLPERIYDEILWDIYQWVLSGEESVILSLEQIEDINNAVRKLKANNEYPYDYPQRVKQGLQDISIKINEQLQRSIKADAQAQAKNLLSGSLAGLFNSRNTRSLRAKQPIETALNKVRLTPWFTGHMSKFLSGAPRAGPQSEGTIDPLMKNLKRMAEGKRQFSLRPRGRGTRTARASPGRTTRRGHRAGPGRGPGRTKTVKNMFVA